MTQNPLVTWQYEQIEAECALLSGHVTDPECPCESDTENCIRKHLLTIEALAKETYPMDITDQEKQGMADLADQARTWRKKIEQYTIGSGSPEPNNPNNPREPIRTEALAAGAGEVKIFNEKGEFHAGSFRTIKHDENTLVLVGCPVDSASFEGGECICRDTGERGCMELHSITSFQKKNPKPSVAETERRIDEAKAEIEALDSSLKANRARELIYIIPRRGTYKGEVKALTIKQFRELLGYDPPPAVLTNGHVRWEYILDQLASERGFASSDDLKEGIERARDQNERLQSLRSELSYLKASLKEIEASPPECETIKLDAACPVFPREACRSEVTECDGLSFTVVRQPSYWIGYSDGTPQFVQRYARDARKELREVVKPFKG